MTPSVSKERVFGCSYLFTYIPHTTRYCLTRILSGRRKLLVLAPVGVVNGNIVLDYLGESLIIPNHFAQ